MLELHYSLTGWIHLFSSLVALVLGSWVLIVPKGTRQHRRLGYGYAVSMIILNSTAFMLYRLFGTFGPFHLAATASVISITLGLLAAIMKNRIKNWRAIHFSFMYWSVIGLYAAFFAEIVTRVDAIPISFFWKVTIPTVATIAIGWAAFISRFGTWSKGR